MGIYTKSKEIDIGIEWSDLKEESQQEVLELLGLSEEEFKDFYNAEDGNSIASFQGTTEEPFSISEFVDVWFNEADINGGKSVYHFSEEDLRQFKIDLIMHILNNYMG